ncbi:MAG: hypothetical protein K1V78_06345, partial [Muribaculaceae bacterium]
IMWCGASLRHKRISTRGVCKIILIIFFEKFEKTCVTKNIVIYLPCVTNLLVIATAKIVESV